MRIIYMGTPDFAVPTLEMLVKAGHDVIADYSPPLRPAGRGKALRPTPVHARAEAMGLEVRTPGRLTVAELQTDRQSVVSGRGGQGRVELGGRRVVNLTTYETF